MDIDDINGPQGEIHVDNSHNLKSIFINNNDPILVDQTHECKYYNIEEFQNKVHNLNDKFSTLSLNIRSFPGKKSEFDELIADLNFNRFKFSLIAIQEVWNIPEYMNSDIPGYHPLIYKLRQSSKSRESNRGGGVGCWVRNDLQFEILKEFSIFQEKVFESLFLKIKITEKNFKIIGNIYRPPNSDFKQFNDLLESTLNNLTKHPELKTANEIQLMGDINIDLLKYDVHNGTGDYLNTLLSFSQLPLITLPSRITNTTATLIDHISSNNKTEFSDCGLIYSCISDHLPVFRLSTIQSDKCKPKTRKIRNFSSSNKLRFKTELENVDWSVIAEDFNPVSAFNNFSNIINSNFEECFP
jgi:hypothetical protein